jgi:competence protein ComFC
MQLLFNDVIPDNSLLNWIVPRKCELCLFNCKNTGLICSSCRKILTESIACYRNELSINCLRGSLWEYTGAIRNLIHQAKTAKGRRLLISLGELLVGSTSSIFSQLTWDYVIPVPASQSGKFSRLLDHTLEIAKGFQNNWNNYRIENCPTVIKINRKNENLRQTFTIRSNRKNNIRNAFNLPITTINKISGSSILILDDVMTTGATIDTLTEMVFKAGAKRCDALVVATVL